MHFFALHIQCRHMSSLVSSPTAQSCLRVPPTVHPRPLHAGLKQRAGRRIELRQTARIRGRDPSLDALSCRHPSPHIFSGVVQGMEAEERRAAYAADVTYVTNSELGFDYLRDNLAQEGGELVLQRAFNFCIIDEVQTPSRPPHPKPCPPSSRRLSVSWLLYARSVYLLLGARRTGRATGALFRFRLLVRLKSHHACTTCMHFGPVRTSAVHALTRPACASCSYAFRTPYTWLQVDSILIDEARTPLIISGQAEKPSEKYIKSGKLASALAKDVHYTVDEKQRNVLLTEDGCACMPPMNTTTEHHHVTRTAALLCCAVLRAPARVCRGGMCL